MEDDRARVDLGIAADIEEAQAAAEPVQKQPKKRFVGRRTADATAKNGNNTSIEDSGAIQGMDSASVHIT
jgi:2-(3-amino-3-carboxypropyl)histidine synthase